MAEKRANRPLFWQSAKTDVNFLTGNRHRVAAGNVSGVAGSMPAASGPVQKAGSAVLSRYGPNPRNGNSCRKQKLIFGRGNAAAAAAAAAVAAVAAVAAAAASGHAGSTSPATGAASPQLHPGSRRLPAYSRQ